MNKRTSDTETDADPNSISIEKAQQIIFAALPNITDNETLAVHLALGRVLASDVLAPIDVPSFRASAMDGYAYRHKESQTKLRISDTSLAGHPSSNSANQNECHRVTTGARIPDFADTVVQQENVSVDGDYITLEHQSAVGHHVRPIGSNSEKNTVLLRQGQRLGAAQIASLFAHGIQTISALRKLKVALFSTGDELIDNGGTLNEGEIFDANRALLANMLSQPSIHVIDLGIVADTVSALEKTLHQCNDADLVLSSGGVSVGDADFVRPVLEQMGKLHIWKIAVKPGRPLTFGKLHEKIPYFGLPGNPVSAAVTCLLFVKPAAKKMLGEKPADLPRVKAKLTTPLKKLPGRVEYQRGVVAQNEDGEWEVSTTGIQDSHVVTSLHVANCFIELGFDSPGAQADELVNIIPFAHFGEQIL